MDEAAQLQRWLRTLGFEGDEEMAATGERFTSFLREWVPKDPLPDMSLCASRPGGGVVVVRDMLFHSLCAHHLLPFFGTADVAYRPGARLAGLGAIPRLVAHLAQRPQLQERLTDQIADALAESLEPAALVVTTRARHMCVEMRGASAAIDVRTTATRGEVDDLLHRQLEAR